jgi:hypothetical protein
MVWLLIDRPQWPSRRRALLHFPRNLGRPYHQRRDPPRTSSTSPPLQQTAGDVLSPTDTASAATPMPTTDSSQNVWPLPRPDISVQPSLDALSILGSAQSSFDQASRHSKDAVNHGDHGDVTSEVGDPLSGQQGASNHVEPDPLDGTHGEDDLHGWTGFVGNEPAPFEPITAEWTQDNELFTAVVSDGSTVTPGADTATTMASSAIGTFLGQSFDVPVGSDKTEGATLSQKPSDMVAESQEGITAVTAVFTVSEQKVTTAMDRSSLVLQAAGTITTMTHGAEGAFAGQVVSMPKVGESFMKVNGELVTLHPLDSKTSAVDPTSVVWTHNGNMLTAEMREGSAVVLKGSSTTVRIPAGSKVTLDNEVYSLQPDGTVLIRDGTRVTLGRGSYSTASAGSSVVPVLDGKTITLDDGAQTTLGDKTVSAASTGGFMVVNGATVSATSTGIAAAHSTLDGISEAIGGSDPTTTGTKSDASARSCSMHLLIAIALLGNFIALRI